MNLELFSCSGGLAEGLRRGGVPIDMAFDASPDACESYERNHGHRPIQVDARDLLRLARAGWSPGPIDLFVADPPCTPWSRAGKRKGTDDERDMLVLTVELVALLRPDAYLIANVPGLDDLNNWPVVQKVFGGLAKHGYCVADYVSLDAADYGVPQHRTRPFWFGHRAGPCITWPERTHGNPAALRTISLPGTALAPWVTVRRALSHLPPEEMGRPIRLRKLNAAHRPVSPDAPMTTIRSGGDGHSAPHALVELTPHRRHPLSVPDAPAYTITAKAEQGAQGGSVLAVDEWPWDRPATTVTVDERLAPPGHHGKSFLSDNRGHGPNAIILSEKAAGILQGFPDGWVFAGVTKKARWSQIGQAMPPPLAEAVGRQIAKWLRARAGAAA